MPLQPVRVLHLIDGGGPGGAETIYLQLVTGLYRRHDWDPVLVLPMEGWLANALRAEGFQPQILDTRRRFDTRYAMEIRRIAKEEGVSLVQTHLLGSSVYATIACWATEVPVVSTFHGMADISPRQGASHTKLRLLGRGRNRLVFVSEPLRAHFVSVQRRLQSTTTTVIPNGVDCDVYAPGPDDALRTELQLAESTPLIGAVGNLRPPKAYDNLLRAFCLVRESVPEARLIIVGQPLPGLHEDLLGLREALGLSKAVSFLGFREDVARILKSLDLFVLSSTDEGFSLATVQAMATGLPVVATRCGGPETIIEPDVSGLLVPPSDANGLAGAILRALGSRSMRIEMGRRARQRVLGRFSIDKMVERYAELYEGLTWTR